MNRRYTIKGGRDRGKRKIKRLKQTKKAAMNAAPSAHGSGASK